MMVTHSIGRITTGNEEFHTVIFYGDSLGVKWLSSRETQRLYRAYTGEYLVHSTIYTEQHGKTTCTITIVGMYELQPGGRYEALGAECDLHNNISIFQALEIQEELGLGLD